MASWGRCSTAVQAFSRGTGAAVGAWLGLAEVGSTCRATGPTAQSPPVA